jgi:hypothetical protein
MNKTGLPSQETVSKKIDFPKLMDQAIEKCWNLAKLY